MGVVVEFGLFYRLHTLIHSLEFREELVGLSGYLHDLLHCD